MFFIGSANQSNIDALHYFIEEIFPAVKTSFPEATLLVAGPVCRVLDSPDQSIIKCGEPENLDELYGKASVVINPIRFGTGLKIKNIEALGYAKPLVTTPVGAEGLENGADSAFLVADDASGFARHLNRILTEEALYCRLCDKGYAFAWQWNQLQTDALAAILGPEASPPVARIDSH
jgi:glycosyltransferase involved in cell wall biosynthesis